MQDPGGSKDYNDLVEFLAMVVFAAIPLRILFAIDPAKLDVTHFGLIAVAVLAMIVFPIRDRLTSLSLNTDGVSATLDDAREKALKSVASTVGADVAETVRAELEKANSVDAVESIRRAAIETGQLKINAYRKLAAVVQAIQDKKKLRILYKSDEGHQTAERLVIPLDVQAGRTDASADRDYLWVASDDSDRPQSLLLSNVLKAEVSDESFNPSSLRLAGPKVPRLIHRDW